MGKSHARVGSFVRAVFSNTIFLKAVTCLKKSLITGNCT